MSGGKSGPPAPDYRGAAEAQGQSSKDNTEQQTWANRPDINTPFGNQSWSHKPTWDPVTGQYYNQWNMGISLNPEQQKQLDSQQHVSTARSEMAGGLLDRMKNDYKPLTDWNQFQNYGKLGNVDKTRSDAEDANYARFTSRLDPQWQKAESGMKTQLYNQGLKEGDPAYDQAMKEMGNQKTDAYQQAMSSAVTSGGEEAQRQFNMGLGGANYDNQVRQQQIAEEMTRRGWNLNEINSLTSGQQVGMPNMPGFATAGSSSATPYMQAAQGQGQSMLDQFNAAQAGRQGTEQGLASLAMLAMML
jgi:hypothetical protein